MSRPPWTVRYTQWVVDHPWWVILGTLMIVLAAASGARHLTFTTDYRVFFSRENPQLLAFQDLEDTYTKNDNVLIVLAPKDGSVFTRETLSVLEGLTDQAWQVPYSRRVDSITNFQYSHASGDDLVVEDLVHDAAGLDAHGLRRVREVALHEPLLVDRLVSPSGHVAAVNVTMQLPGKNTTLEVPKVVAYVRDLADRVRAEHPDIAVHLTGIVMMNNAFAEASKRDMASLVPVSFAVIVLAIGLLLRGWAGTLAAVWIIVFSILTAMGLTGWLGIGLTPPSASAPTIIMTLGVADSVHIISTLLHAMRQGATRREAIVESMRINFQPVFLTSLTTAVGFLSMNFSDAPPFRDLGNITALGVAAAFVYSVTFLPALIALLPLRPRASEPGHVALARFAEFVIARRRPLLWGMGALVVLLISFVPRNELNDVFVDYFDETVPFRVDADFVNENLGGLYNVQYSLPAGESGGIADPGFLRHVEDFAEWYRAQPETVHVNSYTDIMKRLNKNMHGDDPAYYRLPESRELAAQYLLLYEMSLPYGLDLNDQINVDKSATRLGVTLKTLSTNGFLDLERRVQTWLAGHAPSMRADGTSATVMFAHIGRRNIHTMLTGTTVALLLISLVLVAALRSIRLGLVSLVPNLVPAGMAFGLWGLLVGEVGLSLSVVTAMTLGIVVDDTVHFLTKYQRARREQGLGSQDAVRYAFASVGMALWVTSWVLVAGFLVLSLSSFELNAGMGLLTAVVISLALLVDFLFLPPLLMRVEESRDASVAADPIALDSPTEP